MIDRTSRRLATIVVAAMLAGCSTAAPSSPSGSTGPSPVPSVAADDCPHLDTGSGLSVDYLSKPAERGSDALVVEVLIAEETGEVDLGRLPILASYRLVGSAPVLDSSRKVLAFEAGSPGSCAARMLVDADMLEQGKGMPRLVEVDVSGAMLGGAANPESSFFCTWLPSGPGTAAIECVAMPVTGEAVVKKARAWVRVTWAAPVTTTLPAWAVTALGPEETVPADAGLLLDRVDPTSFALGPNPPLPQDEPKLRATAIAGRGGQWVVAGGYSPLTAGSELSDGDARVWFSPDGTSWSRVDTPEVFGGEGYQAVHSVVAVGTGWWALGGSYTGDGDQFDFASRLWHSADGRTWSTIQPHCAPAMGCGDLLLMLIEGGRVGELHSSESAIVLGQNGGVPSVMTLDVSGAVTSVTALEMPSNVDASSVPLVDITAGPSGWLLLARVPKIGGEQYEVSPIAWRSADGRTWTPLAGDAAQALTNISATQVVETSLGWFAIGKATVWHSDDLVHWAQAATTGDAGVGQFVRLVVHGTTIAALGYNERALAISSTDGIAWSPIGVAPGDELGGGASDGTKLLFVGSHGADLGVWVAHPS